ncbi:calcium-binding protein [Pseudooctadecabacter sp.]|uniref:calcium-binding protein n=1 Tax=Pseudooctadecabacter sp. TaxID=1966338 RepID=UPI0035C79099
MELLFLLASIGLLSLLDFGGGSSGGGTEDEPDTVGDPIEGTELADDIEGTSLGETITGSGGFDDIAAGGGDDVVFGGFGQDLIEGGAGDDILNGENWNDGLFGGAGDDDLYGGSSNDILVGGDGSDTLYGGSGNDDLIDSFGADTLYGGDGDDTLVASDIFTRDLTPQDYSDLRDGALGRDEDGEIIFEGFAVEGAPDTASTDTLYGGAGDDTLLVGNNDVVFGGDGEDDFVVGDWVNVDGEGTVIRDFDTAEDVLIVALSDDNADAEVDIIDRGATMEVQINGQTVVRVEGTFDSVDGLDGSILTTTYTPAA